jgi:predicted dehydrogenase
VSQRNLSRRSFVRAAAGTMAVASLVRAGRARAADAPESAGGGSDDAVLRWGIIGTGTRGAFTHIPVLKEAPKSRLVALCDVSEQRLQAAASKAPGKVATYSDYQQLLADGDVNAVVIATPNLFHREMLLAAVEAGKHVLCEKPAGVNAADAAAVQRAAEAAKTVVMFGMQYRNNARQRQIAGLLASGRIGKPRYVVQNVSRGDWNRSANVWQYADPKLNGGKPANWRFSYAATGGTLNKFDCHYFDLLHGIVGALPERVSCDGGISVYRDGRDTWDHATVTLKYPGGVTAVHTLCLFGPVRNDLMIVGDAGSIESSGETLRVFNPGARGTRQRSQDVPAQPPEKRSADAATLRLYEDFLECVKTGKKPDAGARRAVAASRTCWVAELAASRHAEVKWDELNEPAQAAG